MSKKLTPIPAATNISVDEVSYLKYHRYLTNVVDVDRKVVIWNERGRKTEILDKYYEGIGQEACSFCCKTVWVSLRSDERDRILVWFDFILS